MIDPTQLPEKGVPYALPSSKVNKSGNVKQTTSSGGMLDSIEMFLAFLITAPYWISIGVLGAVMNRLFAEDEKKRLRSIIIDELKIEDETKMREMEAGLSHFSEEELNLLRKNIGDKPEEVNSFITAIDKADVSLNGAIQFLKRPVYERQLLTSILSVSTKGEASQIFKLMSQKNLQEFYSFKLKLENQINNKETVNKICHFLALVPEEDRIRIINAFPFEQIQSNQPLPTLPKGAEEIFNLLKKKE